MKKKTTLPLCSLILAFAWVGLTHASEPTFTRVTTGPGGDKDFSYSGSWVDYDGDGYIDLFVVNGSYHANRPNFLYHNNRDGTFTRMTTKEVGSIVGDSGGWRGGAWGDYDNDGLLELCVAQNSGQRAIYHKNPDGRFLRSLAAGPLSMDVTFAEGALWGDYDGDGLLDILVVSGSPSYGVKGPNLLYHNSGGGIFTKVTTGPIFSDIPFGDVSFGGLWTDFDNDGNLDLVICGGAGNRMFVYRNKGRGQFEAITQGDLPQDKSYAIELSSGDYDNDGLIDLFLADYNGSCRLFHNEGNGSFTKILLASGANRPQCGAWGDYDNDGDLDLFITMGDWGIAKNRLYQNNGDGTFTQVTTGSLVNDARDWCGAIWGDYDNDGFLDLFVTEEVSSGNALYHNEGNSNHWAMFNLVGNASNKSAIGAKVRVKATIGGKTVWQVREISGGNINQQDLRPHFGLGDATNIDLVRIEWPSGNVQEMTDVTVDKILKITEALTISPAHPSASVNGSVSLRSTVAGQLQWRFEGVDLAGQTKATLVLTNLTAEQQGHYSVVVTSGESVVTNFTYLLVDTQFTKITEGAVATDLGNSWSASWGDYDNDGYPDLFLANYGSTPNALYHNNRNGTFTSVQSDFTRSSDLWVAGAWADLDNDGQLDLIAARDNLPLMVYYNQGDRTFTAKEMPRYSPSNIGVADYDRDGLPDIYLSVWNSARNELYHNLGNRSFAATSPTDAAGALTKVGTQSYLSWADYDDDGWPDVYAADYSDGGVLLRNEGLDGFRGTTNLVNRTPAKSTLGAWGDYDNDGRLDLFVACGSGTSALYRNVGNGEFEHAATVAAMTKSCGPASWTDYDNDGFLDLFTTYPRALFRNNGDRTFTQVTTGSPVTDEGGIGGLTSLWFDYDNSGFPDLLVLTGTVSTTAKQVNYLYRNNGNSNAWLTVKLVGTASNRDAIGAKVRALATYAGKARWQRRDISGGDGFNGNHLYAHFGLGNAKNVATLKIEWPSGTVQEIANVATNQFLTLWEPPSISAETKPDGACVLSIRAEPNRAWQIQASSDLATWETIATITNTTVGFQYTDTAAAGMACRFYQLKSN